METEQIQIIVDMIMKLSDTGFIMFLWWVVLTKVMPVVGWCTLSYFVYKVFVRWMMTNNCDSFICSVRDILKPTQAGRPLTSQEMGEVFKTINMLIAEKHINDKE